MTFDYSGQQLEDGSLEFRPIQTVRTTVGYYVAALSEGSRPISADREHFLDRVKRKARLAD